MTEEIVEGAKAIQETAKATGKAIDGLLKYYRIERAALLATKTEERLRKRGIETTVPVAPKMAIPLIENATLEDDDELHTLWANLLANAVNVTPPGGSVSVRAMLSEHGAVRISVRDQNKSVPENADPLTRSRFGQVENGTPRSYPAGGLDLPLSVAFMKMLGANVEIDRVKDEGSEITIIFPAMRSAWRQTPQANQVMS